MSYDVFVMDAVKLFFWFLAAFFSIIVWSRTRNTPWLMIVFGTISQFTGVIYDVLEAFGIISYDLIILYSLPVIQILFIALPPFFFVLGFISFLVQKKGL